MPFEARAPGGAEIGEEQRRMRRQYKLRRLLWSAAAPDPHKRQQVAALPFGMQGLIRFIDQNDRHVRIFRGCVFRD